MKTLTRSNGVLEVLIGRIQSAIESGVIEVLWEGGVKAESKIALTDGELARLLIVLFPEEHREYVTPTPTTAPPGSARKVRVMSERLRNGLALFGEDGDMRKARGRPVRFREDLLVIEELETEE